MRYVPDVHPWMSAEGRTVTMGAGVAHRASLRLDEAGGELVLKIDRVGVHAYTIPTDGPDGEEADGTLVWDSTTLLLVEITAGDQVGIGYSYGDAAALGIVASTFSRQLLGRDPFLTGALRLDQTREVRNSGRSGLAALALSAVDVALWDLKAKLLDVPLFQLLGAYRDQVAAYASGGFCNYPIARLVSQVSDWVDQGFRAMKIKTSREPERDPERLDACCAGVGGGAALMVDANGALTRKPALYWAERFRGDWGIVWFEEPVSSEDRRGLRMVRDRGPAGLEVAAGEYGFVVRDFVDLIGVGAIDCMQADVTRCGGITGFLQVAAVCRAHALDLSAHCAPIVSLHAMCAAETGRHLEYFHDHVRVESLLFDGASTPRDGILRPDPDRPGLGVDFRHQDARKFLVFEASERA